MVLNYLKLYISFIILAYMVNQLLKKILMKWSKKERKSFINLYRKLAEEERLKEEAIKREEERVEKEKLEKE